MNRKVRVITQFIALILIGYATYEHNLPLWIAFTLLYILIAIINHRLDVAARVEDMSRRWKDLNEMSDQEWLLYKEYLLEIYKNLQ